MEKLSGIYCIENKVNNKKYIGKSVNIYERWRHHKIELNHHRKKNQYFQRAWDKYGKENFKFYIIELCSDDELNNREIYWINYYNTINRNYGYNMTKGGTGGDTLSQHTPEEIKDINTKRSKAINKTRKKNINNGFKAVKLYKKDVLEIIDLLLEGYNNIYIADKYKVSNSTINDIRNHNTWKELTKDYIFPESDGKRTTKLKNKAVTQYTLDGLFIATYESARIAEKETNIGYKLISSVCNGKKIQTHGYIWRFKNDPFDKFPVKSSYFISVDQYDMDGNYIASYSKISDANKSINSGNVNSVINGTCKSAGGYLWSKHK